jgi:hypothetical protein
MTALPLLDPRTPCKALLSHGSGKAQALPMGVAPRNCLHSRRVEFFRHDASQGTKAKRLTTQANPLGLSISKIKACCNEHLFQKHSRGCY